MTDNLGHIEHLILPLLAQGANNRSISQRLDLSERTVEEHIASLLQKLGLQSRAHVGEWFLWKDQPQPVTAEANQHPRDRLTSREREVAALIARGMSNREIAAELVIAETTVAVHVKRVLSKTGCHRRAGIAALVSAQGQALGSAASAAASVPLPSSTWSGRFGKGRSRSVDLSVPIAEVARELSDEEWMLIVPLLPAAASTGRPRADDRQVLNGILWVLGTESRWEDVPRVFGAASTCYTRFCQWQEQGVWSRVWHVLECTRGRKHGPVPWTPVDAPEPGAVTAETAVSTVNGRREYASVGGAAIRRPVWSRPAVLRTAYDPRRFIRRRRGVA